MLVRNKTFISDGSNVSNTRKAECNALFWIAMNCFLFTVEVVSVVVVAAVLFAEVILPVILAAALSASPREFISLVLL